VNAAFWNNRSVLMTGHTGFKGSWMSLWLQRLGAHLTGYSLAPPTTPSLFEQAHVAQGMASITGDLRDVATLRLAVSAAQPEVIFHLAAQSLVRASYEDPIETYSTNVVGTAAVLEAARRSPSVRAVVIVTTDKCYDNREILHGYAETDRLGGHDPYSSSKACAELVTDAYRSSFFSPLRYGEHRIAVASARAGNVIGGGDWARDRIIPDTIRAFLDGKAVAIRNPASTRPWQHVLEPLAGYLLLGERLVTRGIEFGEPWNFGPPEQLVQPVSELATKLAAYWGDGASWTSTAQVNAPHEARMLQLDASKARSRLGWKPLLSLETSLEWIVEWHKAVSRGEDARALTEHQIARYASLMEAS
jgi:CDP-glucose 4,6-dehydratase